MGAVAIAALWVAYSVGMWGWTLVRGYCVTPADIVNPGFPAKAVHWAGSEVPPKTQATTPATTTPATTTPATATPVNPHIGVQGGGGSGAGTPVTQPGGGITLV